MILNVMGHLKESGMPGTSSRRSGTTKGVGQKGSLC